MAILVDRLVEVRMKPHFSMSEVEEMKEVLAILETIQDELTRERRIRGCLDEAIKSLGEDDYLSAITSLRYALEKII